MNPQKKNNSSDIRKDTSQLHTLILACCNVLDGPMLRTTTKCLAEYLHCLKLTPEQNKICLMGKSSNGFSHIDDAVYLPYHSKTRHTPEFADTISSSILQTLLIHMHKTITQANQPHYKIHFSLSDFVTLLTNAPPTRPSPLYVAIFHNNINAVSSLIQYLSKLNVGLPDGLIFSTIQVESKKTTMYTNAPTHNYIQKSILKHLIKILTKYKPTELQQQLNFLNDEKVDVLQMAFLSQKAHIVTIILDSFKHNKPLFLQHLQHRTKENFTILHNAALCDCNIFKEFLHTIYSQFPEMLYKDIISDLANQRNTCGFLPNAKYVYHNPEIEKFLAGYRNSHNLVKNSPIKQNEKNILIHFNNNQKKRILYFTTNKKSSPFFTDEEMKTERPPQKKY